MRDFQILPNLDSYDFGEPAAWQSSHITKYPCVI
jgi:hypothetical protein